MRRALPTLLLVAAPLVFFRHVLFHGGFAIPWDLRYYHLPLADFVARSLARGELPLWSPYVYCGMPLYANLTAQVFYPPALLTFALSNLTGGERLLDWLEWQIALHVALAGVFAFLLLRRLGCGRAASFTGAGVFELGSFFASQTQHLGAVNAAAWLPLSWLAVVELAARVRRRWVALLAVSLALSLLAGFPAVTAVAAASSLLLAALLALTGRARRRAVAAVAVASVWAAALAAIQLLPTAELTRLSVARYRADFLGTGGGIPLAALISLLAPNYYGIFDLSRYKGPWEPTFLYLYCGIPGLVLALGAVAIRRNPHAATYGWMALVAALVMFGDATPLGRALFPRLPSLLRSSIYPEFALAWFALSVGVLAGLGAKMFFGAASGRVQWSVAALAVLDLIWTGSGRPMNTASLAAEPGLSREAFDGSREVLERVRALAGRSLPPDRIDTVNDSMNWALGAHLIEIPTAGGNDPFALDRYMAVRRLVTGGERWGRYYQLARLDSPVLDLLNVRYVLSRTPLASAERAGFRRVAQLPGREVYENLEALPRFFLVGRARPVRTLEEALAALESAEFDPRRVAAVEGAAPGVWEGQGRVRVRRYRAREVELEVETEATALLVSSEAYYPGWRAFLDGRAHPLLVVNGAFRGLVVPPGRHCVLMRFEPRILASGAVVSALAWLAALACVLPARDRLRR
ncbi:MAG: YfhO family protein [Bryobacterales bacterium]|nr:YfhO family protein [Bryobacterales bacterium]